MEASSFDPLKLQHRTNCWGWLLSTCKQLQTYTSKAGHQDRGAWGDSPGVQLTSALIANQRCLPWIGSVKQVETSFGWSERCRYTENR